MSHKYGNLAVLLDLWVGKSGLVAVTSRRQALEAGAGGPRRRVRAVDGIGAAAVSNLGPRPTRIQRLRPEKVDLVTEVLDIENVGDQIAV